MCFQELALVVVQVLTCPSECLGQLESPGVEREEQLGVVRVLRVCHVGEVAVVHRRLGHGEVDAAAVVGAGGVAQTERPHADLTEELQDRPGLGHLGVTVGEHVGRVQVAVGGHQVA